MPVVAAFELDHQVAAGGAARQPDRAHRGLGAAVHEPHLLHDGDRSTMRSASSTSPSVGVPNEVPSAAARSAASTISWRAWPNSSAPHDCTRSTYAVAVDVGEEGALTPVDEQRRAAHAPEGPDRRIHAARDHGASASEQVLGSGHGVDGIDRSRSGTREHDGALVPVQAQDVTLDGVGRGGLESRLRRPPPGLRSVSAHPPSVGTNGPTDRAARRACRSPPTELQPPLPGISWP